MTQKETIPLAPTSYMAEFEAELKRSLAELHQQGLRRELRRVDSAQSPHISIKGETLLNFSSNDYLGLANEPLLKEAAVEAVNRYGAGAGGSRLICGSLAPHHKLEEALAEFKRTEASLTFSTGYAAAVGTISALLGSQDIIVLDRLVHACIVDAARLCRAKLRVFAHNNFNDLEEILKWAGQRRGLASRPKTLVVTESVFSMDGDHAPLQQLIALKERYGAWLMVDEAHATGLYGANRRGLAEEHGVSDQIEIQMGTLGKAFGASGGYICGSRHLIDYLVSRSRSFMFSTAPVPAATAAARAGVRFVQSDAGRQRCAALWQRVVDLHSKLCPAKESELKTSSSPRPKLQTAIIPLLIGDELKAVDMSNNLRAQGIFIPAIRYPTVARRSARLRLTMTAAHTTADVERLIAALQSLGSTFHL